jgi:hypothetical protein
MHVSTSNVSGPQQVQIAFEIDSSLLDADRTHVGTVQVMANAGQKLTIRVLVDVRWPQEPFTRRLLRPFFVGALLALMWRLLLALPADVFGRIVSKHVTPQTLESWLSPSGGQDTFLRPFVLATFWIGAVLFGVQVLRRGGGLADIFWGVVAGAGAGVIGAASLACLLLLLDALPRAILTHLGGLGHREASPLLWLPLWVALASLCWAVLGGGAGFLLSGLGQRGLTLLRLAGEPFAWVCRVCGLHRAEAFFLLQG